MADIPIDKKFYDRANEYIKLANEHCDGTLGISLVSGSFMFALSRFNSWVSATDFESGAAMKEKRQETIDLLVNQYRSMLEQNLDDHINNFDRLMTPPAP
ncbi:DUF3144 domain-containing protein [Uliginosibacterium sp. H3]|uniref:DUF3144 domain-containing protein n=1 Tax=Uliginosibacterium silvisoli TaxID=3114758 RepID=A0ABU6K7W3_9RHOO|nr:DUF3144 domain-containing protein [Uliginosibacterium sp. H3]